MKIREWLSSLDDLYQLYAGTVLSYKLKESKSTDDLDQLLFELTNQQEDAEKELKKAVVSFLDKEYTGRVDRLLASDIYIDPRYTKLMYAFYQFMHSLGKYRIYLFCDIPDAYKQGERTFCDIYLHFRAQTIYYKRTLRPEIYTSGRHEKYPSGEKLREVFEHWKVYIHTEMCNDGFDCDVIWKKMIDLLCTLAVMDTMLRET